MNGLELENGPAGLHTDATPVSRFGWSARCNRMEIAIDEHGNRVPASKARRHQNYRCPECKVRVIFVRGEIRAAHFKHWPRTLADKEREANCSAYWADAYGGSSGGVSQPNAAERTRPRPRLAFEWVADRDSIAWGLLVSVPKLAPDVAYVAVDGDVNGSSQIQRETIEARRRIWVKVVAQKYRVSAYSMARQLLHDVSPSGDTELLEDRHINLFHAGTNGGFQLDHDEPVIRGKTYFALSRRAVWSPPSSDLVKRFAPAPFCDSKQDWLGHLVYVPLEADATVSTWIEKKCRRTVENRAPTIELVSPPACTTYDGRHSIPSEDAVLIAIRGENWGNCDCELDDNYSGESCEWEIGAIKDRTFVSFEGMSQGDFDVHVKGWNFATLTLDRQARQPPRLPEVALVTASNTTREERRSALHTVEGESRWNSLFDGSETWVRFELPLGIPLTLTWGTVGLPNQVQSGLKNSEAVTAAIVTCLQSRPTFASLEGAGFCRVHWERSPFVPKPQALTEHLPQALIRRLQWLLLTEVRGPSERRIPLGLPAVPTFETLVPREKAIVEQFLGVPTWPVTRISHARAAARTLLSHMQVASAVNK